MSRSNEAKMTEVLFNKRLHVFVKGRDAKERRSVIRITIELQFKSNPVHRTDLVVRLTDDSDLLFLFNLVISEEDFLSLKVQQGLLVDFTSFPQKFIDFLELCICEQDKPNPRFVLQMTSASPFDHGPSTLDVVDMNPFKHLTHLSLKMLPGSDADVSKYLASCLSAVKEDYHQLELRLRKTEEDSRKTEEDLSRQLKHTQQTLSEKSRELDKQRSEWTSQTSSLSSRHMHDLTAEREKTLETQTRLQQQSETLRQELEASHHRNVQQIQSRVAQLEASNRELTERKYKSDATIRELRARVAGLEEECQRSQQQNLALRRENGVLHETQRLLDQQQSRVAALEQEIKDKDQLLLRTEEALEATQQQKNSVEGNAKSKQMQIGKLEATVKCVSKDLIKANSIIKKFLDDEKVLVGKINAKNAAMASQEKILKESAEMLQDTQQRLRLAEDQVVKMKEQLDDANQKLEESRATLESKENIITWLNKGLNEKQFSRTPDTFETPAAALRTGSVAHAVMDSNGFPVSLGQNYPITSTVNSKYPLPVPRSVLSLHNPASGPKVQFNPISAKDSAANKENGEPVGLDPKYFERRDASIPLRGLLPSMHLNKDGSKSKPIQSAAFSTYFPR